ncbi:hypothetical protein M378DRAFT_155801 [Amanita muscaria Koide BX008]|uniref:Uncharacterized protein n=1 Tax=Amanita muscaria (strain Koide BX008) TaxID=946122 RepID=A0A0C2T4M7_AMAMK|nr:hypothetical protein M378DRAFT_155801 [Amanita muscaria Koide BX008]
MTVLFIRFYNIIRGPANVHNGPRTRFKYPLYTRDKPLECSIIDIDILNTHLNDGG